MKNGKLGTILFYILLITSVVMLIISFFLPPKGTVDPSVLSATAEVMGFASLGLGADLVWNDKFHRFSFKHKDIEINAEKMKETHSSGI